MTEEQEAKFKALDEFRADTPQKAMTWVDGCLTLLSAVRYGKFGRDLAPKVFVKIGAPQAEMSIEEALDHARMYEIILRQSEIVLFDNDIWQLAHKGAEIFQNKPYTWDHGNIEGRVVTYVWSNSFNLRGEVQELLKDQPVLTIEHMTIVEAGNRIGAFICAQPADLSHTRAIADEFAGQIIPPRQDILDMVPRFLIFGSQSSMENPYGPYLSHVVAQAFMKTTVAGVETHQWGRQIRKDAKRNNKYLPLVKTVVLRRRENGDSPRQDHKAVDWQHQWVVSGHWRNQWFPKAQENKPIFIDPYVKGPEGKPLLQPRKTVYSVVR